MCQQRRALVEIPAPQPKIAGRSESNTEKVFIRMLEFIQ